MNEERWLRASERWLGLLLRLYPTDFREELGEALVEAYRDRCRAAIDRSGVVSLGWVWLRALADSLSNGMGERLRPAVTWRRTGNWGRDTERVLRRLVRAPVCAATMVGTLTVGLGAFAMVYTAVDKVLIEPLPYERPEDLYFVWRDYSWTALHRASLRGFDVAALDSAGGVIAGAVGLRREVSTLSDGVGGDPEEAALLVSSAGLFELLGVRPVLGRGVAPDEAGPGRPPVVVLGHDLWRRRFGADPSIVGSAVHLDGRPFRVIGVMGRDFRFRVHAAEGPPQGADAYITFDYALAETNPYAGAYAGLIRARPGTAADIVAAAVGAVGAAIDARDLYMGRRGLRFYPVGMKPDLVAAARPALVVLGLAGVFFVFVLGLNLATLLLARAAQREREFAVSRALGANGLALARATLLEGGLLGLLGGAGGALAAVWGTRLLVALAPLDLPRRESIAVDWEIAAVVTGSGALLGLLAGAIPAAWAARSGLTALLANTTVRGGGGHGRMRRGLVVVQVALSLVLLSAGGLVVRSFERLLRVDPGFRPAGVLTLRIPVPYTRYPDATAVRSLHERIASALAALPGVTAVGAAAALPLSAAADWTAVTFPGAPGNTGDADHDRPRIDFIQARPGYFEAMGIRVLAGRAFAGTRPEGAREAIIDRTLAATFFGTRPAVGARLVFLGDTLTVIGVVEHARMYDVHRDGISQVYIRNARDYTIATLSWALRTDRPPLSLIPEVRAAIRRVDPQLALADIRSMDRIVGESLRQQRLSAVLVAGFSLGALLLAAMGLFGVVSGSVTRRRHELAVRLALGADHGRVLRLVLREGMLVILLGLLLGVPGIYLSGQAIRGVLVGVSPFDAPTLAAVACGLAVVALAACYVPARRVTRIEPAGLLREE